MVENRSSLFGIIALIIGASGLGVGVFSVVNFQVVEGPQGPPGEDGQDAPWGLIVRILEPDQEEIISGNVTIRALIYGSKSHSLSILRNGTEIGTSTPMKWDTTTVSEGWWNLTVIASDINGNQSQDTVIVFIINTDIRVRVSGVNMAHVGGGMHVVNYTHKNYDSRDDFNLTSDMYTVPFDGYYIIISKLTILSLESRMFQGIFINGIFYIWDVQYGQEGGEDTCSIVTDIQLLKKDDTIYVLFYHLDSEPRNVHSDQAATYLSIALLDNLHF